MDRTVFVIATLLQAYFIPLVLVQIFLTTATADKSAVLLYMITIEEDESIENPAEIEKILNQISFVPIFNLLALVFVITLIFAFVFYKEYTAKIIISYYEQSNPIMYNLTNNLLKTLPILHEVETLRGDDEGFVKPGMRGIVIEEIDGKYDILFPYQAVVTLKKEDVKDVQTKVNS